MFGCCCEMFGASHELQVPMGACGRDGGDSAARACIKKAQGRMYPVTRVGPHPALSLHERCLLLTKLLFSDQGPYFVDITARIALGACGTEFRPVLPEWTSELHRYSCYYRCQGSGNRQQECGACRSPKYSRARRSRVESIQLLRRDCFSSTLCHHDVPFGLDAPGWCHSGRPRIEPRNFQGFPTFFVDTAPRQRVETLV